MRLKIIAWLAYDVNGGGENTTGLIETANKIINTQGKSIMLDFFTNCSDLCQ